MRLSGLLGRLGPTDTGLLRVALHRSTLLITDDARTLFGAASEVGVECRLAEYLIG